MVDNLYAICVDGFAIEVFKCKYMSEFDERVMISAFSAFHDISKKGVTIV